MSSVDLSESYESSNTYSDFDDDVEITHISSPFNLQWTFGFDTFTPVINLSTANRSLIAYASSHATVLYDYKSRKMFKLQGHRNCVRMLSVDQSGRWLLTADFDHDSTVVIWDIEKRIPIFTLFNPHKEKKITATSLSPDAKYIVTVGDEDVQSVKIWYWTLGENLPDAETNLTEISKERVKDIAFDWKNPNFFALTTDSRVVFVRVDNGKNLIVDYPSILKKPSGLGIFNNTAFIAGTTKAFTGTENGFVLTWDIDFENRFQEEVKMIHIKSNPLQKANITKLINYSNMIVTGNSRGEIIFYDSDLDILYACRDCGLDSVTSISFDIHGFDFERREDYADDYTDASNRSNSVLDEIQECFEISSNVTMRVEYPPKPKHLGKSCDKKCVAFKKKFEKFQVPRDATLQSNEFSADKFIVVSRSGKMFWIDIPSMQYRKLSHYFNAAVTAIDVHPQDKYFVVGDEIGSIFIFNYLNHQMMLKRSVPNLPDLLPIIKTELINRNIIHITYASVDKNEKYYPSAMKYSPRGTNFCLNQGLIQSSKIKYCKYPCILNGKKSFHYCTIPADVVICAMQNGAFWALHPGTFETLDEIPYRHSDTAILDVVFSSCSEYMAYYDEALTVAVFKRHKSVSTEKNVNANHYDFVGKYRSHKSAIKCILFGPPISEDKRVPRLLSLGEDKELIEYDLSKSGTYPKPGLVIREVTRVEDEHVPFFMDWYPQFGVEKCLVISNSDYKFKLIDAGSKKTRATFLGSSFDTPIKKMIIHQVKNNKNIAYMVFATDKLIGIQLLPLDGNPYKILTSVGHPKKITWMRISHCGNLLFTAAKDDRSVLMWRINYKSVEIAHRLGGIGLTPFYSLIDGGKEGWLFQEMQDLFVFAQILEQGKNSMKARRIDDEVTVDQLPNLMRSVGFYPSNYEMENLMDEVVYKHYASTGRLNKRITFEEFVKLYVNHRPTFGISMQQLKNAFSKLAKREGSDDISISKQQFYDILCSDKTGDGLNAKEICKYLEYLIYGSQSNNYSRTSRVKSKSILEFLPERISYEDFVANVMGITLPKEIAPDTKSSAD